MRFSRRHLRIIELALLIWILISFDVNSHNSFVQAKESLITSEHNQPSATCSSDTNENGSAACSNSAPEDDIHVDGDSIKSDEESPKSLRDFMKVFNRLGTSWSHVFGSYLDVVKTAHGKDMEGDVYADDIESGVAMLQNMVAQALKEAGGEGTKEGQKWTFDAVPLQEFGATMDDVFVAFLRWSGVDSSNEDEHEACKLKGGVNKREIFPINVSKAFRRLTAYATWMDEQKSVLLDPPLTLDSVRQAKSLLYSRVTHDDCGRVVWWLDLGQTKFKEMKHLAHEEILRFFVWLSHLIMTDENAQRNGIMFLDSMDSVSFYQYMTMLPYQLGITIDKFMIGVTPLKTKLVVFLKRPLWFDVGFGLLSVFLPTRMKKRVSQPDAEQASIEDIVGSNIPVGFDNYNGTLAFDLITKHEEEKAAKSYVAK
uniref:CRAL-TRIO domain-containing protein n=1 Tax=Minutocellus polymorphus TaxID=265543 RepID=A0A7S0AVP7_9STRA|mmetsp:Transcript_5093/g.8659  ORF Transcript_5093/g.8659 Transcript_5093/m.8659 type:complete len:426 (+) Transcript_5093:167-1444(+)|eukprot:CAMPEP_0197726614 /NCGR_PEP_ID=MMETSP1434-20131217/16432_1 /TAXON_ID=265543 /ORGANISM="Minutocellus polymorphus, Strain CCMP3303" /LENGTH=425 /DNA_ID=CAMNT_0043312601 /DNA_START=167 /DNA_END=1444 /DNA_ORIENTATION=+